MAQRTTFDPAVLKGNGNYYALVIGNKEYPERSRLSKLETPVKDAQDIADILTSLYGFKVKLLLNATRDKIIGSISEYRRTLSDSDNLLIYYAGHGYLDRDAGGRAYWLPVDAEKENKSNWISADDITGDLGALASRHVLIIADSCYSGAMLRDAGSGITPEDKNRFLLQVKAKKSRTLMTSGAIEPVSDGGGAVNSVFAEALIKGLSSEEDAAFSAGTLFSDSVRIRVGGRANQTPLYGPLRNSGDQGGDFIFVRSPKAALPGVSNSNSALENYNSGTLYSDDGKWPEAEAEYQKAVALEPGNAIFRARFGGALYAQRKYAEAETAFREATRLDPKNASYRNMLGNCLANQNRPQEAETVYLQGLAIDPQHFWLNWNLANTLNVRGEYKKGEPYAKKAVELAPNHAEAQHVYALNLAGLRQLAAAEAAFQRALEIDPKPSATWNELGNVQWDTGNYKAAEASYRKAIELSASTSAYHSNLAGVLFFLRRYEETEAEAKKALEISDENARGYYWLGRALYARNRALDAERALRRAAVMASTYADTHNRLAETLAAQKRWEEAVLEFKEAIRLGPNNAYYHSNLADAYKHWDRPDLAEASYKRAIEMAPADPNLQRFYGVFLFDQKRLEEAKALFTRILAAEPTYWLNYDNLGTTLVRLKDFVSAEQVLNKSIQIKSDSASSYYFLAESLEGQGKLEDALKAFEKAAAIAPSGNGPSQAARLKAKLAEKQPQE